MNYWKLTRLIAQLLEQVTILKTVWNLAPVLLFAQKIPQKHCPRLQLSIGQVWWLNDLWFKRYIKKCAMSQVLIFFMMSQIW